MAQWVNRLRNNIFINPMLAGWLAALCFKAKFIVEYSCMLILVSVSDVVAAT